MRTIARNVHMQVLEMFAATIETFTCWCTSKIIHKYNRINHKCMVCRDVLIIIAFSITFIISIVTLLLNVHNVRNNLRDGSSSQKCIHNAFDERKEPINF